MTGIFGDLSVGEVQQFAFGEFQLLILIEKGGPQASLQLYAPKELLPRGPQAGRKAQQ